MHDDVMDDGHNGDDNLVDYDRITKRLKELERTQLLIMESLHRIERILRNEEKTKEEKEKERWEPKPPFYYHKKR